jgi:hypothetical protein
VAVKTSIKKYGAEPFDDLAVAIQPKIEAIHPILIETARDRVASALAFIIFVAMWI